MNVTCIICSDSITANSEIFATPCGHLFHYPCLIQWIERSKTCPQCRNRTTEKTIHRIYFNIANTDYITDDAATLQNKIDNLQFQMNLKEKDIKTYSDKYKKVKNQNLALREEVAELENKMRIHDSVVQALKDQISYFKSKSKEKDRLVEEISLLKSKLKSVESVQIAINGTREEVNDMLRNENDVEALVILTATLKKALLDTEKKKLNSEHKLQQLQNDVLKYRRDITSLKSSNEELKKELQLSKKNWGQEKEHLTNIVLDMHTGSSDNNKSKIKRILSESPMPLPQKRLKNDEEIINLDVTESPKVEDKVIEILDSDSPYLPVKSNIGIPPSSAKLSIFKGASRKLGSLKPYRSDEIIYDGLGGQGKKDLFPSSKTSVVGIKRHKPSLTSKSLKVKKLTPTFVNSDKL